MKLSFTPDAHSKPNKPISSRRDRRANKRELEKVKDKKLKEEIKAFLDKEGFEY